MFCRLCQGIIAARFDTGRSLPRWVQRHLAHCSGCRAAYQQHQAVASQLAIEARQQSQELPPFLQARIAARLADAGWAPAPSMKPLADGPIGAAVVGLGCVLVLATWLLWPPAAEQASSQADRGIAVLEALAHFGNLVDGHTVLEWGARLDAPLATELKLVIADAQAAWNGLVRSLPEVANPRL